MMSTPSPSLKCAVCGKSATQKCSGCQSVVYCGRDHQKDHWIRGGHKQTCKSYKIMSAEQFGRYLIATRDIKRDEIILTENPTIVAPKTVCYPTCLGCLKRIVLNNDQVIIKRPFCF